MGNPTPHAIFKRAYYGFSISAFAIAALLAVLALALPASGAPPGIGQKRQQAQSILAEIDSLDSNLNRAVEAYNGARLHLAQTQQAIRSNAYVLNVAKRNLKRSQRNIAERLVALYTGPREASTIEIVLGARSLSDALSQLDAAEQVSAQDARIAREATSLRTQVSLHRRSLIQDRKRAVELVAETQSRRDAVRSSIAKRQQLLASVKGEIARMQAAERQRQLQIAAQVRARLVEQAKAEAAAQNAPQADAASPTIASTQAGADPTSTAGESLAGPAPPSRYGGSVAIAMRYLGIPYKWGGASPETGFDCSGFTMYVYAQIGVSLPHYTGDQWSMGTAVSRSDLQPGDLVFFDGLGHEGLYIGNDQFIHSPHTGDVVKISSLNGWYAATYMGARRL